MVTAALTFGPYGPALYRFYCRFVPRPEDCNRDRCQGHLAVVKSVRPVEQAKTSRKKRNIKCHTLPHSVPHSSLVPLFHRSTHTGPQIYTHRATNLAENIFEQNSPFSRKSYIVCKIVTKMFLQRF